ncbi:MAG: hypothetical protein ABID38_07250 [Candidatus Diapherotrites archaeon]
MGFFCPRCYAKSYVTRPLKNSGNGEWACGADSGHRFMIDKDGYPRLNK